MGATEDCGLWVSAQCTLENMECYTDAKAGEVLNPVQ